MLPVFGIMLVGCDSENSPTLYFAESGPLSEAAYDYLITHSLSADASLNATHIINGPRESQYVLTYNGLTRDELTATAAEIGLGKRFSELMTSVDNYGSSFIWYYGDSGGYYYFYVNNYLHKIRQPIL